MIQSERDDLATVIQSKVFAGNLPKDAPARVWAGYGTGKKCDACDLITTKSDIEYEVDMADRRTFVFHAACLNLWHQERARFLRP